MITIVVGKPGSGKSYDCVKNLLSILEADIRKGSPRKVYTNLSLKIPEIEEYLAKRLDRPVDLSKNIVVLEPEFFEFKRELVLASDIVAKGSGSTAKKKISDNSLGYWWNRFDEGAYIIIDEIQQYLSSIANESRNTLLSISQYFSTHRHRRHDIVLITQALTTLSLEVRKYAEVVREVVNSKSISIPFPFNISGRDLDILRAGFGVTRQLYRVRVGALSPSNNFRPDFQGEVDVVTTSPEIYSCYKTHSKIDSDSSSTDFDLPFVQDKYVKFRAVFWFLKKNSFNFGFKIVCLVLIIAFIKAFFSVLLPGLWGKVSAAPSAFTSTIQGVDVGSGSGFESLPDLSKIINSENKSKIPLDRPPNVAYSSSGLVKNGVFYAVGDILPNGLRLKSIDLKDEEIIFEPGENFYFASACFVDFCSRMSRELQNCEDCF